LKIKIIKIQILTSGLLGKLKKKQEFQHIQEWWDCGKYEIKEISK
jgi:hypothetical protein